MLAPLSSVKLGLLKDFIYTVIIPRLRVAYVRNAVVDVLVIPSTCIHGRDIVIAPLVRVCVCVSVCLSVCVSPLNS